MSSFSLAETKENLLKETLIIVVVDAYFLGARGYDCERMALDLWYFSDKKRCRKNPELCVSLINFSKTACEIGRIDRISGRFTLPRMIHSILQK